MEWVRGKGISEHDFSSEVDAIEQGYGDEM
jgi:hypothetical protein